MLQELLKIYEPLRYILDFGIIAILIYCCLFFLRGTRGVHILVGFILVLLILTGLVKVADLPVLKWLLTNFWTTFAIALVVIFQPELRRAFAQLGTNPFSREFTRRQTITEVVHAVVNMSHSRTGALIVFERKIGLASFKNTAIPLEAKVSERLLLALFFPNAPLHDGALIIHGDTIEAGHAILPLTVNPEYAVKNIGTRHRAAIGITEETDAVAVVVSEETGGISASVRGVLHKGLSPNELQVFLEKNLMDSSVPEVENE